MMFKKLSQNFVKSPLKFCLISQILVYSLWHVWMCCRYSLKVPNRGAFNEYLQQMFRGEIHV